MSNTVDYDGGFVYDATTDKWYTDLEQAIYDIEYEGESKAEDHELQTSLAAKVPVPDLWDHITWSIDEEMHERWDPSEHLTAELAAAVAKVQKMLEDEAPTAHYPTGKRIRIYFDDVEGQL